MDFVGFSVFGRGKKLYTGVFVDFGRSGKFKIMWQIMRYSAVFNFPRRSLKISLTLRKPKFTCYDFLISLNCFLFFHFVGCRWYTPAAKGEEI